MDDRSLLGQQFAALRDEINATKTRLFYLVVVGSVGIPLLVHVAFDSERPILLLVPYSILILIVAFINEQNAMMRAGRYIRERIESKSMGDLSWEQWLESKPEFRMMERHFVGCFVVIFFVFYVITIAIAVQRLAAAASNDLSGQYDLWLYGTCVTYLIGAIWAFSTLIHHWKSTTSTAGGESRRTSTKADGTDSSPAVPVTGD